MVDIFIPFIIKQKDCSSTFDRKAKVLTSRILVGVKLDVSIVITLIYRVQNSTTRRCHHCMYLWQFDNTWKHAFLFLSLESAIFCYFFAVKTSLWFPLRIVKIFIVQSLNLEMGYDQWRLVIFHSGEAGEQKYEHILIIYEI